MSEGKKRTYVCKRLRLATYLVERGFKPYQITPDRDNPMFDVYLFDASLLLYRAVTEFFTERNGVKKEGRTDGKSKEVI